MLPLAEFWNEMAPVLALLVFVMIPVVAILSKHQQKMAHIMRQPVAGTQEDALLRLAAEVRELRQIVNQQTLTLDTIAETNRRLSAAIEPKQIEERLSV